MAVGPYEAEILFAMTPSPALHADNDKPLHGALLRVIRMFVRETLVGELRRHGFEPGRVLMNDHFGAG